jgi:hypothetical protein
MVTCGAGMLSEESMTGSRKGKMQIGGHFDPRDVFTLQEVLVRESRERGSRKTMQEALEELRAPLPVSALDDRIALVPRSRL